MKPVMYIILNKGAGMSPGKLAAQAAHAAVEAYRITPDRNLKRVWHRGGHYTKIVLEADDEQHLFTIERYIRDRGFDTALIIDEGRTETRPHTATACGVEVVDKDDAHAAATFSSLRLFTSVHVRALDDLQPGQQVTVSRAGDQYVTSTVTGTQTFEPAQDLARQQLQQKWGDTRLFRNFSRIGYIGGGGSRTHDFGC